MNTKLSVDNKAGYDYRKMYIRFNFSKSKEFSTMALIKENFEKETLEAWRTYTAALEKCIR